MMTLSKNFLEACFFLSKPLIYIISIIQVSFYKFANIFYKVTIESQMTLSNDLW